METTELISVPSAVAADVENTVLTDKLSGFSKLTGDPMEFDVEPTEIERAEAKVVEMPAAEPEKIEAQVTQVESGTEQLPSLFSNEVEAENKPSVAQSFDLDRFKPLVGEDVDSFEVLEQRIGEYKAQAERIKNLPLDVQHAIQLAESGVPETERLSLITNGLVGINWDSQPDAEMAAMYLLSNGEATQDNVIDVLQDLPEESIKAYAKVERKEQKALQDQRLRSYTDGRAAKLQEMNSGIETVLKGIASEFGYEGAKVPITDADKKAIYKSFENGRIPSEYVGKDGKVDFLKAVTDKFWATKGPELLQKTRAAAKVEGKREVLIAQNNPSMTSSHVPSSTPNSLSPEEKRAQVLSSNQRVQLFTT